MSRPYHEIAGLEHYYFEDSYVLGIHFYPNRIVFDLDVILTERHGLYRVPQPAEQYCFRRARLSFEDIRNISELTLLSVHSSDITGERDLGNIDNFVEDGQGTYQLSGLWGQAIIDAASVSVTLMDGSLRGEKLPSD